MLRLPSTGLKIIREGQRTELLECEDFLNSPVQGAFVVHLKPERDCLQARGTIKKQERHSKVYAQQVTSVPLA